MLVKRSRFHAGEVIQTPKEHVLGLILLDHLWVSEIIWFKFRIG